MFFHSIVCGGREFGPGQYSDASTPNSAINVGRAVALYRRRSGRRSPEAVDVAKSAVTRRSAVSAEMVNSMERTSSLE